MAIEGPLPHKWFVVHETWTRTTLVEAADKVDAVNRAMAKEPKAKLDLAGWAAFEVPKP
jgi:hypothetical protein